MTQPQGLISLLQNRGNNEDSSIVSQFSPIGSLIEGGPKGYANHYMLPFMLANMFNNDDLRRNQQLSGWGFNKFRYRRFTNKSGRTYFNDGYATASRRRNPRFT